MGALRLVAKNAKVAVPDDAAVTVTIGIGKDPADGGFGLVADIVAALPGLDQATADELSRPPTGSARTQGDEGQHRPPRVRHGVSRIAIGRRSPIRATVP